MIDHHHPSPQTQSREGTVLRDSVRDVHVYCTPFYERIQELLSHQRTVLQSLGHRATLCV
ncbi:hypothetical protein FA13DRAFT_1132734 [Coprinellus micaceus]|uniref:Uncharacterized protein n=1 Tax=Coprinellus micaceus TaxID=71717 RepID=A0A4Y7SVE6_COPMI|nr:hypothetical protein FA13DRAFT_1132734 [Coprinellus micaceus]